MRTKQKSVWNIVVAGLLLCSVCFSALPLASVSAALLSPRSITLSSSAASANASYNVAITTSGSFQSLVIDFCSESPIIGSAACTGPTGFSVASPTVTFTTGSIGTVTSTASSTSRLKISGTTAQAAGSVAFTIANITNPSTVGTFYARIYTYSNNAYGTPTAYSSASSVGSTVDTGGVAISTANVIQITATVQETLLFCVSKVAPTANCGGTTTPAVVLGHGSPLVLTATQTDTDTAYTQLSTNASSGASLMLRNLNTCSNGGLSNNGGTNCPIAGAGATATAIAAGSALFGMNVGTSAGGTGANVSPAAPYNTANYAMDYTTSGNNVTSPFGDQVASAPGPTNNMNNLWTFAAGVAPATPAGIYTAVLPIVAVGTF